MSTVSTVIISLPIYLSSFPSYVTYYLVTMSVNGSTPGQKSARLPSPSNLRDLPPVPVYDVTKFPDERTHKLRALLEAGHVTVAPLRDPELILHSHLPHVC